MLDFFASEPHPLKSTACVGVFDVGRSRESTKSLSINSENNSDPVTLVTMVEEVVFPTFDQARHPLTSPHLQLTSRFCMNFKSGRALSKAALLSSNSARLNA